MFPSIHMLFLLILSTIFSFHSLLTATITLYWSTFGLNAIDVLKLPQSAKMLEIAGLLMYAMFYVFVVVVLLNALIAVMSEVYSEVEVMALLVYHAYYKISTEPFLLCS